jgi:hypothetical protein
VPGTPGTTFFFGGNSLFCVGVRWLMSVDQLGATRTGACTPGELSPTRRGV